MSRVDEIKARLEKSKNGASDAAWMYWPAGEDIAYLLAELARREAQVECYEEGLKYISKAVAYLDQSMCRRVIKACSEIASEALAKGKAILDDHKGRD